MGPPERARISICVSPVRLTAPTAHRPPGDARGYSYLPAKINLCENGRVGLTDYVKAAGVEARGVWGGG